MGMDTTPAPLDALLGAPYPLGLPMGPFAAVPEPPPAARPILLPDWRVAMRDASGWTVVLRPRAIDARRATELAVRWFVSHGGEEPRALAVTQLPEEA